MDQKWPKTAEKLQTWSKNWCRKRKRIRLFFRINGNFKALVGFIVSPSFSSSLSRSKWHGSRAFKWRLCDCYEPKLCGALHVCEAEDKLPYSHGHNFLRYLEKNSSRLLLNDFIIASKCLFSKIGCRKIPGGCFCKKHIRKKLCRDFYLQLNKFG